MEAEGNPYYRLQAVRHLIGIHAVSAAVRAASTDNRRIERLIVARGARSSRVQGLIDVCRELGIPVRFEPRSALQRLAGDEAHQNVVAIAAAAPYATLESVMDAAGDRSLIVALDTVQDPRNLGAIVRTADGAGADAVIVPERRSASLTETASKAAAGALESQLVVRVKNLGRALERLKDSGYWVYGFDATAKSGYDEPDYADRCVLVLGGESRGLREKVSARCDFLVRIPMAGSVSSLNVSVAAGIALFEVGRQQRAARAISGDAATKSFRTDSR